MSSITEDLKRTFGLASLRQRAKSLTRPSAYKFATLPIHRHSLEQINRTIWKIAHNIIIGKEVIGIQHPPNPRKPFARVYG